MEGIIMAKKLGKLFTLAVTAGTAAAAAYYYLQNKKAAVQEASPFTARKKQAT